MEEKTNTLQNDLRLAMAQRRLFDEVYQNTGLQGILDTAANIIENSIVVHDTTYNVLARSYRSEKGKMFLEQATSHGFIREDLVLSMREHDVIQNIRVSDKAALVYHDASGLNWLFKTVRINEIPVADIASFSDNRPFEDFDIGLFETLAKIVAIELQKDNFFKMNKGAAYSYFLQDILEGRLQEPDVIRRRAKDLNWHLSDHFQVAVAESKEWNLNRGGISYAASQLTRILPAGRWTVYNNRIAAIFSGHSSTILTDKLTKQLTAYACDNGIAIGLSDVFTDLKQIPMYYSEALHASQTGRTESRRTGVKLYSEVMSSFVVQVLLEHGSYMEYLHPGLIRLEEYDHSHHVKYMDTIREYFRCGKNVTETAARLNIHRNTILYQLGRIADLTGIDLKNGEAYFKIMLHFKIREYLN